MFESVSALAVLRPGLIAASIALLCGASLNDVAVRTIPDLISLGIGAVGVALRLSDGTLVPGVAVAAAVFAFCALCWRCGWLGGGDAKLLAASALLMQPAQVPRLMLATALAGGALACLYLALGRFTAECAMPIHTRRSHSLAMRVYRAEWWRARRRGPLPYGCAIAAGAIATLFMD
jgi:prepilin peptidase CpaA